MNMKNNEPSQVVDSLFSFRSYLVVTHMRPDGDAIGSVLALKHALEDMKKDVVAHCIDPLPENLKFLPGSDSIQRSVPANARFDSVVFLDCGAPDRAGDHIRPEKIRNSVVINIDHHINDNPFGDLCWVDTSASSTCEMLYDIFFRAKITISSSIATCLYTGLLTDTGSFQFSNTTGRVLEIASKLVTYGADPQSIAQNVFESASPKRLLLLGKVLDTLRYHADFRIASAKLLRSMIDSVGASTTDSEGFVNMLRQVKPVKVAVLFREDNDGRIHVGLRSKDHYDVSSFAKRFGGGGHAHAAACRLNGTIDEVEGIILPALVEFVDQRERSWR